MTPESRNPTSTPTVVGMIQAGARILLVPGWVIAIAMTLKGYVDIGDGFSGGVIAALIVLTQGLAFGAKELEDMWVARIAPMLTFIGLGMAYAVAEIPVLFGQPVMTHYPKINEKAHHFGALELITPVLFDIAIFMVVYGFCVGIMMAISRAEVRHQRIIKRARKHLADARGSKNS